jgi:hypothetical protein
MIDEEQLKQFIKVLMDLQTNVDKALNETRRILEEHDERIEKLEKTKMDRKLSDDYPKSGFAT